MEIISSRALETKQAGQKLAEQILSGREKEESLLFKADWEQAKQLFFKDLPKVLKLKKDLLTPLLLFLTSFN